MQSHLLKSVLAALAITLPAASQSTVSETYETGGNLGGWTWGVGVETPSATGGNPGAYLQNLDLQTVATPTISTTSDADSPFLGDWAAGRVLSVGIDLILLDAGYNPGEGRKLSLVVLNDNDTPFDPSDDWGAYLVSDQGIPNLGSGPQPQPAWRSYDFEVPAESTFDEVPPGWGSLLGPVGSWAVLMSDVDSVSFTLADPTTQSLITSWELGVDNPRITRQTWQAVGSALPGANGAPVIAGKGTLLPNSAFKVSVDKALPNALSFVVLGFSAINVPFEGGVMVPSPDKIFARFTDSQGSFVVSGIWPDDIPTGTQIFTQVWVSDPGGPYGLASTLGLLATAP